MTEKEIEWAREMALAEEESGSAISAGGPPYFDPDGVREAGYFANDSAATTGESAWRKE